MKKVFPLEHPRHAPPRVLDGIKHEVRKYLKRERRKRLPDDADYWAFDCQVGKDGPERVVQVAELVPAIDAASEQGWNTVYIEILAKPAQAENNKADTGKSDGDTAGPGGGTSGNEAVSSPTTGTGEQT